MFSDVVKMRFLIEAVMKKRGNRLNAISICLWTISLPPITTLHEFYVENFCIPSSAWDAKLL